MIKLYEYLYYRLYQWQLKLYGKEDVPEYTALLGVALIMGLHSFTLYAYMVNSLIHLDYLDSFITIPTIFIIGIFFIFIAINYPWFIYKNRYLKIVKKYENENKRKRQKKLFVLWIFVLFSFFILFLSLFI